MAWVKVKSAASYAGVSPRTVRKWLKSGLRHSQLPSGTVLIQYSAVDEFLNHFEVQENEVDRAVEEIQRDLNNGTRT